MGTRTRSNVTASDVAVGDYIRAYESWGRVIYISDRDLVVTGWRGFKTSTFSLHMVRGIIGARTC